MPKGSYYLGQKWGSWVWRWPSSCLPLSRCKIGKFFLTHSKPQCFISALDVQSSSRGGKGLLMERPKMYRFFLLFFLFVFYVFLHIFIRVKRSFENNNIKITALQRPILLFTHLLVSCHLFCLEINPNFEPHSVVQQPDEHFAHYFLNASRWAGKAPALGPHSWRLALCRMFKRAFEIGQPIPREWTAPAFTVYAAKTTFGSIYKFLRNIVKK